MMESGTIAELNKRAAARLNPKLTDPNYLVLRKRRDLFRRWLSNIPGSGLQVLDVGGRLQPYRPLLEHRVARYVAVDPRATALVDIAGKAEQLPLADGMFDVVFCTQVLEYVADPVSAIGELYRVLKPGGVLLVSAPSIFPRDSEEEFWRFEPAALRMLLTAFRRIQIEAEGGSIAGFLRTTNVFLMACAKFAPLKKAVSYSGVPLLNLLGRCMESSGLTRNDQFAANYSALAQK
jgi:SAM-dependent methyltransferase